MIGWVAGVAHWGATVPLGQLRAVHVAGLAAAVAVGLVAHRRGWRAGIAVAGVAGVAVALAPAVALLRPAPVDGRDVVPGARLWRAGGASVLVVDDLRASPEALLSALHLADVRRLDVLVVARPGIAAARDVAALLARFPPRLVLAPAGNRLPGEVTVPAPGSALVAGGLTVRLDTVERRLAAQVITSPGPPPRSKGAPAMRSPAPP